MEFLGQITNEWAFYAMIVYFAVEGLKWFLKNKPSKKTATDKSVKELSDKMDAHIESDKEIHAANEVKFRGLHVLALITTTHPGCSMAKFQRLQNTFDAYYKAGGNGLVSESYFDFVEKREKCLKNLKNQK